MAIMRLGLAIFLLSCLSTHAFPQQPIARTKNTIFGDERVEGQIFENIDAIETLQNEIVAFNEQSDFRLPKTTRPVHYVVVWRVEFAPNFGLHGTVEIDFVATQENVNEIVLHSEDLSILTVILDGPNVPQSPTFVLQPELQFLRITLPNAVLQYNEANPVTYKLQIEFEGVLRTDMYGIYRSWFRNTHTDSVSWMASTQFQATSARKAFPCYDEPEFKATFDISVARPSTHRSWSGTLLRGTSDVTTTGYQIDTYERTPITSTYLLAIIVAEYTSRTTQDSTGKILYEVIARPGAIDANQYEYAFEVGQELLRVMSEHTDYDFYSQSPSLKMTQAAIPDFSAGAMENWGLLTYREAYLMYDVENTNSYFKQLIAYILSHEIAHMWFGNLVTCDWWDVLWLNEGFARYYQYFLTHWVEDYMELETRFITEQIHTALLSDSANNPQPLNNPGVGSPSAVSAMFSTISYNKGAAVIRMTEHLLGESVHTQGLRNYLVKHAFDVALPIDLFLALEEAGIAAGALDAYGSSFSLVEYYRSWTDQPGHPVLNVHVNHQTGDMTIQQRRFNINTGYSSINNNYIIPITFTTAVNTDFDNTKPTHILRDQVTVINRGTIGDHWVVFNKQQTGYYRVNYDDYTWDLITLALKENREVIHEFNRAQIVNDVFQFARSGLMSYTKAFNILSFLENEIDYAPWVAAITGFTWLRNRLIGTAGIDELNSIIINWAQVVINDLTYDEPDEEDFIRSYLRYQLAPVMCALNVRECRNAANTKFRNLVDNGVEVPVDSRNWVYCNGLREGSESDFQFLWNRFQQHNVYTEKILLLQVLGCSPHANSLTTFMTAIVQDNYIVRPQDYTTAFNSAVTGNEGNTRIAFEFVRNNMNLIVSAFNNPSVPLSYISSRLRTPAEIDEFVTWAQTQETVLGSSLTAVVNNAEATRESLTWFATVEEDMTNYFDNGDDTITTSTPAPETQPPPPVLETLPELTEPQTPELPDSAITSYLSILLLAISILVNIIV